MADPLTRSQKCRQHGLMMPMPDAGRCCWYCARDLSGSDPVPVTEVLDAIRERRVG